MRLNESNLIYCLHCQSLASLLAKQVPASASVRIVTILKSEDCIRTRQEMARWEFNLV